jgi:hypothetical protein
MAEVNTKQWWISELNAILAGSDYEAIDNPTVKENNVVVVKIGTTKPHHIGIKPEKKGKFGMWAKKEYIDALPEDSVPEVRKQKGQQLHFTSDDYVFAMNVARVLAGDMEGKHLGRKKKLHISEGEPNYGISQADTYQMYAYQKKYSSRNVTLPYTKTESVRKNDIEFKSEDGVVVKVRFADLFDANKFSALMYDEVRTAVSE